MVLKSSVLLKGRRDGLIGGLGLWLVALTSYAPSSWAQERRENRRVRLAAASDLKFALAAVLPQFEKETGLAVEAVFGSSGNFARQIRQGLPVDLFMSADEAWVEQLAQAGMTRKTSGQSAAGHDRGVVYGRGRIALLAPAASKIALDAELKGLKLAWAGIDKFAMAHPDHAPYGRAAREALQSLGLWEQVREKLVLGDNIMQATQFVLSGAAQAGITALSLALAPEIAQQARHQLLPQHLHTPLRQKMVLTTSASQEAQVLYDYLQGQNARRILARFGFEAQ